MGEALISHLPDKFSGWTAGQARERFRSLKAVRWNHYKDAHDKREDPACVTCQSLAGESHDLGMVVDSLEGIRSEDILKMLS